VKEQALEQTLLQYLTVLQYCTVHCSDSQDEPGAVSEAAGLTDPKSKVGWGDCADHMYCTVNRSNSHALCCTVLYCKSHVVYSTVLT